MQNKVGSYSNKPGAINYAFRLLNYRDRSEQELIFRLKRKGFDEQTVQDTVAYLKDKGFINDAALAASLRRIAEEGKLLGDQGVKVFLRRRGISEGIINDVVPDGSDDDELLRAEKFVDRRLKIMDKYSGEKIRKKIGGCLMRRGYSFNTIRTVLKKLNIEEVE